MKSLFLIAPVSTHFEEIDANDATGLFEDLKNNFHEDDFYGMSHNEHGRDLAGGACEYNYNDIRGWRKLSCKHECDGPDKRQSPVDVPRTNNAEWNSEGYDLEVDWDFDKLKKCKWTSPKDYFSLGQKHTLNPECNALKITFKSPHLNNHNPVTYKVAQMHMHTPSENTIDGEPYHGCMHFVHVEETPSASPTYAVIGVFVQLVSDPRQVTPWAKKWLATRRLTSGMVVLEKDDIDLNKASWSDFKKWDGPLMGNFWHTRGSLTTPPCTEAVEWFIMKNTVKMDINMYSAYQELFNSPSNHGKIRTTARDTQNDKNKNVIYYGKLVQSGSKIKAVADGSFASQLNVNILLLALSMLYLI